MQGAIGRRVGCRVAASLALGTAMLGAGSPVGAAAPGATAPTWVSTQGNVVHLTVIAGWNNVNAGFNFDGAAHGQMVVTVPLGARVVATFKNNVATMHDVVIIPYTTPLPGRSLPPAFSGAASPAPRFGAGGPPSGTGKPQTFSFVANKAGRYMMICGISGHALAGMWDTFVVSRTAKTASVVFNKSGVTSVAGSTTAPPAKMPTWVSTQGKVVHLALIAGWNNANAGFNFNGGANGHMIVIVPLGDKIVATYRNAATTPHDVRIINYQKPLPAHTVALAFPGASAGGGFGGRRPGRRGTPGPGGGGPPQGTPGPGGRPPISNKPQTFTFVANKAGTYMIMCGFPGHALAGMWDTFVVSRTAKAASITFTR